MLSRSLFLYWLLDSRILSSGQFFFGISSGQIVLFGLSEFLRDYFLKTIFLGHEGSETKNGSVALIFRLHSTTQTQNRS
jgi:hypothetical protein